MMAEQSAVDVAWDRHRDEVFVEWKREPFAREHFSAGFAAGQASIAELAEALLKAMRRIEVLRVVLEENEFAAVYDTVEVACGDELEALEAAVRERWAQNGPGQQ